MFDIFICLSLCLIRVVHFKSFFHVFGSYRFIVNKFNYLFAFMIGRFIYSHTRAKWSGRFWICFWMSLFFNYWSLNIIVFYRIRWMFINILIRAWSLFFTKRRGRGRWLILITLRIRIINVRSHHWSWSIDYSHVFYVVFFVVSLV